MVWVLVGIFSGLVFLGHYAVVGQAVYGDGIGYFAHVRSLVIDDNDETADEYKHVYDPENNNALVPRSGELVGIVKEVNGKAINYFSLGPALLWFVPFSLVYLVAGGSGYGDVYQITVGLVSITVMMAALWGLTRLLIKLGIEREWARWAVVSGYLGTNLLYYGAFDVINSHFASFAWAVAFWLLLQQLVSGKGTVKTRILLGVVTAMMANTRIQDGVGWGIWLVAELWLGYKTRRLTVRQISVGLLVFLMVFSLTVWQWLNLYGSIWNHKYLTEDVWGNIGHLRLVDWWQALVSGKTGLVGRFPLLWWASGYGIWWLVKKKKPQLLWWMLIYFLVEYGIVVIHGGWRSQGYGGRLLISSLPLLIVWWGMSLETMAKRYGKLAAIGLIGIAIGVNVIGMGRFILVEKRTQTGGGGTEMGTQHRLEYLYKKIGLP